MAWSIVQTANGSAGSGPLAVTVTATVSGHLIVVAFFSPINGTLISGITDNATGGSNTYTQVSGALGSDASAGTTDLWYCENCKAGATTITIALSAGSFPRVEIYEVSGIATTSSLDAGATAHVTTGASTATPSITSGATAASGELLIACGAAANNITAQHAGNEFTLDSLLTSGGGASHITSTSATAAAHTSQWDATSAGTYAASIAAWKSAGGAALSLFLLSTLSGLGSGGPFFQNPLG